MISHHLTKIYQTQILNESVYDDALIDALYAATGKDKWIVEYRTSLLKKFFSDEESILDLNYITSTNLETAWKFALREHKNLLISTRSYVNDYGNVTLVYSCAGILREYIIARKFFGEKNAPLAFEYIHNLIAYLEKQIDPNFVNIADDAACKDSIDAMQIILKAYIKTFCNNKRSPEIDDVLNAVLEDFAEALHDEGLYIDGGDLMYILDKSFGETIYFYVATMRGKWPTFEKFIAMADDKSVKLRFNMQYAKQAYNKLR